MNNKIKKIIVLACLILLVIMIIILTYHNRNSINKVKQNDYTFKVADLNITTVENVMGEANKPQLGAGMIPIKYENGIYQIVSSDNISSEWYNYSEGKMALVMLSDGYYISEERQDMSEHELAKANTKRDAWVEINLDSIEKNMMLKKCLKNLLN